MSPKNLDVLKQSRKRNVRQGFLIAAAAFVLSGCGFLRFDFLAKSVNTSPNLAMPGEATLLYSWGSAGSQGLLFEGSPASNISSALDKGALQTTNGIVFESLAVSRVDNSSHICGLTSSGLGYCWGSNNKGQLGNDTFLSADQPVAVSGAHQWSKISLGLETTCGLQSDGRIFCWGDGTDGILGNGTTGLSTTPSLVSGGLTFRDVQVGGNYVCAVTQTNDMYCWGRGEIYNSPGVVTTTPVHVFSGAQYNAVSGSSETLCAVLTSQSGSCLGGNFWGNVGSGSFTSSFDLHLSIPGFNWTSIQSGSILSCGVTVGNALYCWGMYDGLFLQNHASPVLMTGSTFQDYSVGLWHACAVDTSQDGYCWSTNYFGNLGTGDLVPRQVPSLIAGLYKWKHLYAGAHYTCGITTANEILCFGLDHENRFANQSTLVAQPKEFSGSRFLSVSSSNRHRCAIRFDQTLACWGANDHGQLGLNSTLDAISPQGVMGAKSWKTISVGESTSCAIDVTDKLFCWGNNLDGEIGDNSTTDRLSPTPVSLSLRWRSISLGDAHACAVTLDSRLYCWGRGANGQLGTGLLTAVSTPQLVNLDGLDVSAVSASYNVSCAVATSGSGFCWGKNTDYQIGDGTNADQSLPKPLPGMWLSLSAGAKGSCGVRLDGIGQCWGRNASAGIGDGTLIARMTPQTVDSTKHWRMIVPGLNHTCGISSANELYCWGDVSGGRLGIISGPQQLLQQSPILIDSVHSWNQVGLTDSFTEAL